MTFRQADWVFIIAVATVIIFVTLLPTPRDRNPVIPATAEHRGLVKESECVQCHAPAGTRPLPPRHPKRPDCFRCHRNG